MKLFGKVTVIGVGLIGGSVGMGIKKKKLAHSVWGVTRHHGSIKKALEVRAIDRGTLNIGEAVKDADLVIIATPVGEIARTIKEVVRTAKDGCILTDVGSTKRKVVEEIEKSLPPHCHFVGSHPLAGSEKRGVEFATPDLFSSSVCIVTKTAKTKTKPLRTVEKLWKGLGAEVVLMSPHRHDRIVAQVSHVPHLVSIALVKSLERTNTTFASTGFRDTTRVASSDPVIWKDICLSNSENIVRSLDAFATILARLRNLVSVRDGRSLKLTFLRAKNKRDALKKK